MNPVLAGNYKEWTYLMERMKIPPKTAVRLYPYVDNAERIMGVERHTTVFVYGKYLNHTNYQEIEQVCRMRMFNVIKLED